MTKVPLELNNKISKREKPQRYKDIIKKNIYNNKSHFVPSQTKSLYL